MGPLYKWIALYTDEVKDFLDQLADVEDTEGNYLLIAGHSPYPNFSQKNSLDSKNETVEK